MARKRKGTRRRDDAAGSHTLFHLNFSKKALSDLSRNTKRVFDSKDIYPIAKAYKVISDYDTNAHNTFEILEPNTTSGLWSTTTLYKGLTYEFDFIDPSMEGHSFRLSTTQDGPHEGGSQYLLGWSEYGVPGYPFPPLPGAIFKVNALAPDKLYYYCDDHDGEGGSSTDYIRLEEPGQVGYSTEVYKSSSTSAHFSGNAGIFVSGDGYDYAVDLKVKNDFTISFWAKSSATGYLEDQCLFDFGLFTGFVESGTRSYVSMPTGWSGQNIDIDNMFDVDFTEWNHFCLMRTDGYLKYYINGTGQGEAVLYTGHLNPHSNSSSGAYYSIGCTRDYKNFYSGYMDDFFFHDVAIYGRDGFTPMEEDVSGKFFSIAKDGLTAKHNSSRLYLMSDGGYRDFEMYDTDNVYFKLPPTGNIIPKDNRENANQYIYPFSGQDIIISFYKDPNIIDARDSVIKFYYDSGDGRKIMATDSGLGWTYTSEADQYFDDVKLMIQSTAAVPSEVFTDSSNSNNIIVGGRPSGSEGGPGIRNVTNEFKFGKSSIFFPGGKNEKLSAGKSSSPDWKWGKEEWTIDAWIKVADSGSHTVMSKWDTAGATTGCSWILSTESGNLQFDRKDTVGGCGSAEIGISALGVFEPTDWNLISVQRTTLFQQVQIFVNGTLKGSGFIDDDAALCSSDNQDLMIGDSHKATYAAHNPPVYYGWMDSIRITKGVARYSASGNAAPTSRFPDRFNNRLSRHGSAPRGSSFKSMPENSIGITTNLRPQNWNYYSAGNIDVNASHLIINNIQSGFTGTWSAEHWEDGRVYSSPRQVIIQDVIAGTGCVRPQITGLEPRGQIMSLAGLGAWAAPDIEKPTWTGNCLETSSIHDMHLYPDNKGTGICGPYGWTHYRIFSGWLEGSSLPGFNTVSEKRYDGSTDNSHLTFIISEEPLGGKAPRRHGISCGPIANRTGSKFGNNLYREMSFSEVSGIPVTTFDYLNPWDGELHQTSGRLLVTGNGNMHGDNAINGAACMYLTVVDDIARNVCKISHGEERVTCLKECPTHAHCSDWAACNADPGCTPCIDGGGIHPIIHQCRAKCGEYRSVYVNDPTTPGPASYSAIKHVYGYKEMGYDTEAECRTGCVQGGGIFPAMTAQSPAKPIIFQDGEEFSFTLAPPDVEGQVSSWYELNSGEYVAMMASGNLAASVPKIQNLGNDMGSEFVKKLHGENDDGNIYFPVFSKNPTAVGFPVTTTRKLGCNDIIYGGIAARERWNQGTLSQQENPDSSLTAQSSKDSDITIRVRRGNKVEITADFGGVQPLYYIWHGPNALIANEINDPYGLTPIKGRNKLTISKVRGSEGIASAGGHNGCYFVEAMNCPNFGVSLPGQFTRQNFKADKKSKKVCIEVMDETWVDNSCCLQSVNRTFKIKPKGWTVGMSAAEEAALGDGCVIKNITAYEMWPDLMAGYGGDGTNDAAWHRNGRVTSVCVTSPKGVACQPNRSTDTPTWETKAFYDGGVPELSIPPVEQRCYNSGDEVDNLWDAMFTTNPHLNNNWCTPELQTTGCALSQGGCFVVSGCPTKVVYEVFTVPAGCPNEFGVTNFGDECSEKMHTFDDYPVAGGQYAANKEFIGVGCSAKEVDLNWTFPEYEYKGEFQAEPTPEGRWEPYETAWTARENLMPGNFADGYLLYDCCNATGGFGEFDWPKCAFTAQVERTYLGGGAPGAPRVEVSTCGFTPRPGQTHRTINISTGENGNCDGIYGCSSWDDTHTGFLDFVWSGITPTGIGTYSRTADGQPIATSASPYRPHGNLPSFLSPYAVPVGQYDRSNRHVYFYGDQAEFNIKIARNPIEGHTEEVEEDYDSWWLDGDDGPIGTSKQFTRTLSDGMRNINIGDGEWVAGLPLGSFTKEVIRLQEKVGPNAPVPLLDGEGLPNSSQERRVEIINLESIGDESDAVCSLPGIDCDKARIGWPVFSISDAKRKDSHTDENPGGDDAAGFHRENSSSTNLWAHQSSSTNPLHIWNGWYNEMCDVSGATYAECLNNSYALYEQDPNECNEMYHAGCYKKYVTEERQNDASFLRTSDGWGTNVDDSSVYLDLMWVLRPNDVVEYVHFDPPGWNSWMHGNLLLVKEPTGWCVDKECSKCGYGPYGEGHVNCSNTQIAIPWANHTGCVEIPYYVTLIDGKDVDREWHRKRHEGGPTIPYNPSL